MGGIQFAGAAVRHQQVGAAVDVPTAIVDDVKAAVEFVIDL